MPLYNLDVIPISNGVNSIVITALATIRSYDCCEIMLLFTPSLAKIKPNSPITAVGSDTQQAILSGVVLGLAGAVDTLVRNMRKEKKLEHCPVYLVGGDADLVNRYLVTAVQKVPHLTLLGVALDLIAAAE